MAVEAARDALGDRPVSDVRSLSLASTRMPFANVQNSSLVSSALSLPESAATSDIGYSERAGVSGLLQALRGGVEPSLFVASDHPRAKAASVQEMVYGAGAAAFTLGSENVIARLIGSASRNNVFVDHFRAEGDDYDYYWEERWIRDEGYAKIVPGAVADALQAAGVQAKEVSHFVLASSLKGSDQAVAKKLGIPPEAMADSLDEHCGYAGAAHAPLMLALALEKAAQGQVVVVVGFGQGVDVLVLRTTDAISNFRPRRGVSGALADALSTDAYLRMLSFEDGVELEWGMRSEKNAKTALAEQYRSADQLNTFAAGKCACCGTVQFPQLQYCVKCQAPREQFEDVPLHDESAELQTATADWLSYHPAPPLWVGFVRFDSGARVLMEVVDVGPGGVDTGARLRMVYRIKERDRQRGYHRYFWKATPL